MNGELAILNVGDGDTKLTFDPEKPAERERAAQIVTDMLKSGYVILVAVGEKDGEPLYQRCKAFDPKTCEYIVAGQDTIPLPQEEPREDANSPVSRAVNNSIMQRRRGKRRSEDKRLPAESTKAVGVARSAGG